MPSIRYSVRVWSARIALPFLTVFLALLPMRSYAVTAAGVMPWAPAFTTYAGGAAAVMAFNGAPIWPLVGGGTATAALSIGMYLGYFSLCPAIGMFSGQNPCVNVPAGSSAMNVPPGPVAAATAVSSTGFTCAAFTQTGHGRSASEACKDAWDQHYLPNSPTPPIGCPNYSTSTGNCWDFPSSFPSGAGAGTITYDVKTYCLSTPSCAGGVPYGGLFSTQIYSEPATVVGGVANQCPKGYTYSSGTTCNLADAYKTAAGDAWTPRDYTRPGYAMTVHLSESSASTSNGGTGQPLNDHVMTVSNSNDTIVVGGTAADGSPAAASIKNNLSGETMTAQNQIAPGQVKQTQVVTDANGQVTGLSQMICNGTITYDIAGNATLATCTPSNSIGGASAVALSNPTDITTPIDNAIAAAASGIENAIRANSGVGAISGAVPAIPSLANVSSASAPSQVATITASGIAGISSIANTSTVSGVFNIPWDSSWWFPGNAADSGYVCGDIYGTLDKLPPIIWTNPITGAPSRLPDICLDFNGLSFDHMRVYGDFVFGISTFIFVFNTIYSGED